MNASTTDSSSKLSPDALDHLHHLPNIPLVIDNSAICHSISTYLALENSSQVAYKAITHSLKQNFPVVPSIADVLSFYNVEKLISTYTDVKLILNDMCPNTCLAFTGPFNNLDKCPLCQAP